MRKFLITLKHEGKVDLVSPSKNVSEAYQQKAKDCLRAAKILLEANLFENSISQSYYAMYNQVQSLLFIVGIKCENHVAAIYLFGELFGKSELKKTIESAKRERIDKQYYVTGQQNMLISKEVSFSMIQDAERIMNQVQLAKETLTEKDIQRIRKNLQKLISSS